MLFSAPGLPLGEAGSRKAELARRSGCASEQPPQAALGESQKRVCQRSAPRCKSLIRLAAHAAIHLLPGEGMTRRRSRAPQAFPWGKVAERSEVGRGTVTALLAVTSGRLQIAPTGIDILRS